MKNLFVPYELALKLKEKEFDIECLAYFSNRHLYYIDKPTSQNSFDITNKIRNEYLITAPLWQQVIDWLREEKGIHVFVTQTIGGSWCGQVVSVEGVDVCFHVTESKYYLALRSGIEKALELIQAE